ncbi:MAG: 2-dehydropantoate 2-reductase [Gammaproteobacteria bacterium]|nr:2-dehydropantoate 2-reductase [Gammaproteobacteria bacterium]
MRITIMGAGCIGGLIGAALQSSGTPVTLVDRGEHLRKLQRDGLTVTRPDGSELQVSPCNAVADTSGCGVQDVVFVALKAHQITGALDSICTLIGPGTAVVSLQNGIPWWYFQRHGGAHDGHVIEGADPGGCIARRIDPGRVVGCIAYPAASMAAPGHVRHVEGDRFPVGALDGEENEDVVRVSRLLQGAGFKSPILSDIRGEIWLKAIGNLSFNPIGALTHATLADIGEHPDTRALARRMMEEGEQVAARLGIKLRLPIERRLEGARRVGRHRPSMLQDAENGEPLEVEALVTAVVELGELVDMPTPAIANVLALTRLLNQVIVEERVAIARQRRKEA